VVFRLTQDEFKLLQKACRRTGSRNLSDYTRAQLLDRAATPPKADRVEVRLLKFDKRLGELQESLRQVTRMLRQMGASGV